MIFRSLSNFEAAYTSFASGTGIFAIYFMISSMTLAAPVIAGLYNLQPSVTGFIIQAHLLGAVLFLLPSAKFGDRIGHAKILCIGGLIFALSSFLCIILPFELGGSGLILFRFTQGIGDAMIMASSLVLLSRKWKPEQRGESFGIFLFAGYIGYISGLLAGGWLIDIFGWRASFLITIPFTLITGITGYRLSKTENFKSDKINEKFDIRGMILFGPGIILITVGLSFIPSDKSVLLIISGLIFLILLYIQENKTESPLFNFSLFNRNRLFSLAILSDLLYYAGIGAISYLICTYLESVRGFSSFHAAIIILPISLLQGLISPFAGKLSDKIDPKYISATGVCVVFLMLIFYSQFKSDTSILTISIIAAMTGTGFALYSAPNKNAIMSSVRKKDHGNASGIANTFEQTGNLISIGIAVALLTFIKNNAASGSYKSDFLLNGIDLIFMAFGIICLINIIVIMMRRPLKREIK